MNLVAPLFSDEPERLKLGRPAMPRAEWMAAIAESQRAVHDCGQVVFHQSNPFPIIVPCHRVLAAGGIMTKLRLLNIEGAQVGGTPTLFESLPLVARPRRR